MDLKNHRPHSFRWGLGAAVSVCVLALFLTFTNCTWGKFDARDPSSQLISGSSNSSGQSSGFVLGVNAAGMEFGPDHLPGTANVDFALISASSLDFYKSQGLRLIRLPVLWERVQPAVRGALDATYAAQISDVLDLAAQRSLNVIIDIHSYARRDGHVLGDGTLMPADLADLWTKLAIYFKGRAGLAGFDLMNEPNGMPTPTAWPEAAQAAIDAIRKVDSSTKIYLEGDSWSSADRWVATNPTFPLKDPANKIIYSAHAYADRDASGSHFSWSDESAAGVTTDLLTTRISHFTAWCEQNKVPCHLGEIGVGSDDENWNTALDKALDHAQKHGLQVTYWAAGPWWGAYPMSVESASAAQYKILKKYSNPPQ